MRKPKKKAVICSVIALALIAALGIGYGTYGVLVDAQEAQKQGKKKIDGLSVSISGILNSYVDAGYQYDEILRNNALLAALPLADIARQEGDGAIRAYENGCVVRLEGDDLVGPEGVDLPEALDASLFKGADGARLDIGMILAEASEDESQIGVFTRVYGDYYYLEFTPVEARDAYLAAHTDPDTMMRNLENIAGGYILLYSTTDENAPLIYASEIFADRYKTIADTGIDLRRDQEESETILLNDREYVYAISRLLKINVYDEVKLARAVFILPYEDMLYQQMPRIGVVAGIGGLFFVVAIVWVLSAMGLFRRKAVTASQRRQYGPARARRVVAAIGVMGTLAVLLAALFVDSLLLLYGATQDNQGWLDTLTAAVSQAQASEAGLQAQRQQTYTDYARRIATLLEDYPQLRSQATLKEMGDLIGADYLMLYDDQGQEALSSAQYVNLAFGDAEESSTYDFRRLLAGVPAIAHDACVDEVTGLNRELIGVSLDDGDTSDGYGALIVALVPQDAEDAVTVDLLMQASDNSESLCLAFDPESGEVLHASDAEYVGQTVQDLGLPERVLRNNFMDYFVLDGQRWYSCSDESEDVLYHSATLDSGIFRSLPRNALVFSAAYLVAYALLALALLAGYTDRNIDASGVQVIADGEEPLPYADDETEGNPLSRESLRRARLARSPERKAWFAFTLSAALLIVSLLLGLRQTYDGRSKFFILSYVLRGSWEPGINLFAFAKIVMLFIAVLLLLLGLRLASGLLCRVLQKRGETICRLVYSLIKYAAIIGALFSAFNYLGFDTRALLASVGFLSLAVSLGARDLVADVLSGVTIAFSDEYQIGDFVEINNFRGWVQEIGVRSTTLVNSEGNVKSMSNRDVKNVMNLSRKNCRYTVSITVAYDQPLQEVEALLAVELPKIGRDIPEITRGPEYRGITSFGNGGMTLSIIAECREQHYGAVRSRLNRELRLMLEAHGIAIR